MFRSAGPLQDLEQTRGKRRPVVTIVAFVARTAGGLIAVGGHIFLSDCDGMLGVSLVGANADQSASVDNVPWPSADASD